MLQFVWGRAVSPGETQIILEGIVDIKHKTFGYRREDWAMGSEWKLLESCVRCGCILNLESTVLMRWDRSTVLHLKQLQGTVCIKRCADAWMLARYGRGPQEGKLHYCF